MENAPADIIKTYADMEFQFKQMKAFPKIKFLYVFEEFVAILEENYVIGQ